MYTASAGFSQGLKPLFKMLSKYTTKETEKPGRVVVHDRGCALYVQHTHGSQTDAPAFCQNYQNVHKRARHTEGYAHPDHSLHHRVAIHRACGHEANFYLRTFFSRQVCYVQNSALVTDDDELGIMASMPTAPL